MVGQVRQSRDATFGNMGMTRYFTAPARKPVTAEYFYDVESFRHIPTVSDHEATDTGLLDARGETIFRAPPPMGFIWEDDA